MRLEQVQLKQPVWVRTMGNRDVHRFTAEHVESMEYRSGQVVVTTRAGEVFGIERSNCKATWPPIGGAKGKRKEPPSVEELAEVKVKDV